MWIFKGGSTGSGLNPIQLARTKPTKALFIIFLLWVQPHGFQELSSLSLLREAAYISQPNASAFHDVPQKCALGYKTSKNNAGKIKICTMGLSSSP